MRSPPTPRLALGLLAALASTWTMLPAAPMPPAQAPAADLALLSTLRADHPRLLLAADTGKLLRERAAADPAFRPLLDAAIAAARARLDAPPPARELEGIRLLHVSRRVFADAVWLSLAYRVTGEPVFLATAERNLLAAASFSDWNPSHFLDVAEMTTGVALGYDWLHANLSPETRATLRAAIADKGLRPALDPAAKTNWWHTREMNWNQICLGGLTLGALAIAEHEPDLAARSLALLRERYHHGLVPYAPDGIYPEGPSYWRYGTHYTVLTLSALRTALGSDSLLTDLAPFFAGARVQARLIAPSGHAYTFADASLGSPPDPLLFWFATRLDAPSLLAGQRSRYLPFRPDANPADLSPTHLFALLHWQTPPAASSPAWSAWHGDGPVPLAIFRGPDAPRGRGAFYLALKGGAGTDNHAHLDSGSFIFELDGVRWAHDLGMQQYHPLESRGIQLWDSRPSGQRWTVFRYTNQAHNTLTLDDALHVPSGRATLHDFSAPPAADAGITVDLTPALAPRATRASRRFSPRADARALTITDTLTGLRPGAPVRFTLITRAEITLAPTSATLRQSGRELVLRVHSSAAVSLSTTSAAGPADHDEPAPGYQRLLIETPAPASGDLSLTIELTAP